MNSNIILLFPWTTTKSEHYPVTFLWVYILLNTVINLEINSIDDNAIAAFQIFLIQMTSECVLGEIQFHVLIWTQLPACYFIMYKTKGK